MQEEQEEMIKTGKPEKRRPSGFKNGVIIGLVLGLLITGIGAGVGIRAYANLTNNYVIFGPQGVKQTAKDNVLDQAAIKKVDELLSYIDLYYNDSYKEKDIRNAIYKGTLSGLGDPYSVYYTVDEYKDLQTSTNGNYYGIGAALSQNAKTMEVTVVKVYEGTPAEEAGLKNGDEILSVDKYEATSMELSNLVKKIRGKEGTKVHLKVYRSQTGENLEFDVERKNVDIPSVDSKMLSDGIGYIQISEFQSNTAKQFKKALVALEKEDMKGLIVDEYKDLQTSTNGNYYGIGAALSQNAKTMEVTVVKVYEGTPAEEAGLKNGDEILSVDKYEATSMELSNLVKKIRGKEGTKVHLKVYRSQTGENLEFDVERKNVDIPSVDSKMLSDGIGYIQISEFQSNTAKQFKKALAALEKEDMKGLIVDVRSNPGGLVTSVVDILDQILPEGTVVYTEDKYGKKETYTSDASCIHYPMAVLVNGDSASASEIFAGAIKDYDYGTLIGTKTFGKGIVQTVFPLENGDAIKITTAKYYTPKGHYIHGKGIQPDIKLEYKYSGPEDESYDMKYDNQLQKAISVVKEKIN